MNEQRVGEKKREEGPIKKPKLYPQKMQEKLITALAAGGRSAANIKKNHHFNDIIKPGVPKYNKSFSYSTELAGIMK